MSIGSWGGDVGCGITGTRTLRRSRANWTLTEVPMMGWSGTASVAQLLLCLII
jgi:hypothetical protein